MCVCVCVIIMQVDVHVKYECYISLTQCLRMEIKRQSLLHFLESTLHLLYCELRVEKTVVALEMSDHL